MKYIIYQLHMIVIGDSVCYGLELEQLFSL